VVSSLASVEGVNVGMAAQESIAATVAASTLAGIDLPQGLERALDEECRQPLR
jgi:hypothetical protein